MWIRRRWTFPSRWLSPVSPLFDQSVIRKIPAAVFNLAFPADCRVCSIPLTSLSRIPVCATCLAAPQPLVAEYFCSKCRAPFLNDAPLDEEGRCRLCRLGVTGFDAAYAFGEYGGPLRKLIHLFKYERIKPLAGPLGRMLASALPREHAFDVVVPMPLHWRRWWARGFNQAELLARAVQKRSGGVIGQPLRRKRATKVQAGLRSAERRTNVAGAFGVRRPDRVRNRHVLLIDDVLTTGATVSAAAAALREAGAGRITVLTLARADRRKGLATSTL